MIVYDELMMVLSGEVQCKRCVRRPPKDASKYKRLLHHDM